MHVSDGQHVIIPNHLHVPEAGKFGFCFGSFDASFGLSTDYNDGPENDMNPTTLSETSESVEETAEQSSRFCFSSNFLVLFDILGCINHTNLIIPYVISYL